VPQVLFLVVGGVWGRPRASPSRDGRRRPRRRSRAGDARGAAADGTRRGLARRVRRRGARCRGRVLHAGGAGSRPAGRATVEAAAGERAPRLLAKRHRARRCGVRRTARRGPRAWDGARRGRRDLRRRGVLPRVPPGSDAADRPPAVRRGAPRGLAGGPLADVALGDRRAVHVHQRLLLGCVLRARARSSRRARSAGRRPGV
jgi:hypothetical protein